MGYTKKAISGFSWLVTLKAITRLATFARIAVIARVLTPSQFGLYGIAALVLTFLEIITETGINIILIQGNKDLNKYLNTAWIVSILRGFLISLLIIITSPIIALFFSQENVIPLLLLISLVPAIKGFVNPSQVKFQKDLRFDREFILRITTFIVESIVTILLILVLKSPFALVYGLIIGALFETFFTLLFINPKPQLKAELTIFKEILHKGKWITTHGIFNYFAQEGDDIVVGRIMGADSLGIYQMAYKISILPISEITDVAAKVVLPVYSRIDHNSIRLKRAFLRSTAFIAGTSIFFGSIIFIFSKEIILLVLGTNWVAADGPIKILIIYGVLRAISGSTSTLFLAREKQNYVTIMTLVRLIVLIITVIPLVLNFGIIGASISALLSVLFEIPVIIYFVFRIFKK